MPERLGAVVLSSEQSDMNVDELLEAALGVAGGWDMGGRFIPFQRELMALLKRVARLARLQPETCRDEREANSRDTLELLTPLATTALLRTRGRIQLSPAAKSWEVV